MNVTEFTDWLKEQGCTITQVPGDSRKYVLKITSPGPHGSYLFYNAPVGDRPVKCYTICNICDQLNLQVHESCHDHARIAEQIKGRYY
ncbi:MAG: hypothetical protein ABI685_11910, partial [Ferruginibacter sp.]